MILDITLSELIRDSIIVPLVTSSGGIFITILWQKKIYPCISTLLYRGYIVEGIWDGEFTYNSNQKNTLIYKLTQKGKNVSGEAESVNGVSKGMKWVLDGFLETSILTLTYKPQDKKHLDTGSITLMLVNNGETLTGHINYYSNEHRIESIAISLIRRRG